MAPGGDFSTNLPVKDVLFLFDESSKLSRATMKPNRDDVQTLAEYLCVIVSTCELINNSSSGFSIDGCADKKISSMA